ncbi:Hypothetical protein NTJ_05458 [Nesidiocoris tenuis]|uniref:Protein MIS12 homolog n=1 Tax=Nesidiocoris tenuis TaxID=355587 RepID=A0ABN7AK93_9HEMI|nr:Hypothetical protein NTJ_05458 [Nesidiocoris tenuis]
MEVFRRQLFTYQFRKKMDCSNQEYETQFYGFNQTVLVAEVKDNIIDVLETVINNACAKLKTKYEPSSVDKFAKEALQAYQSSIERHIPALTEVARKYFSINPSVLLPEDEIQQTQYSEEEEKQLIEELATARKEYIALVIFEQKLKDHLEVMSSQVLDNIADLEENLSTLERDSHVVQDCIDQNFSMSTIESIIASLSLEAGI